MDTLQNLLVQEKTLVSQMQAMGDLLSGVRDHIAELKSVNGDAGTYNLPSETLSAIFEAGLSNMPKTKERSRASLLDQPRERTTPFELLVSSVSRRWRYVALQTPQLWTVLVVGAVRLPHDLYDLYLYRSKKCSLDITLDCSNGHGLSELDCEINVERHLERLIPHVGRWRKFTVRSPSGSCLSPLSHLRAPALETLILDFSNGRPGMELFSGGAPRLSSLELTEANFRPPLAAIKYLKLSRSFFGPLFSYDQFSRLIQPMRSLTCLSIAAVIVSDWTNHSPIELQSVLTLHIYFNYRDTDSNTLRILDFPAVETLTIHSSTKVAVEALTQSHRTYPHVQSLTLANDLEYGDRDNTPVTPTLDFISLLPNVRDVVFQGTDPIPILNALHERNPTNTLIWADLSTITVVAARRAKVMHKKQTWTSIVEVVESRVRLRHRISSITLSSQIVERGGQRQKQRLRKQVALTEC